MTGADETVRGVGVRLGWSQLPAHVRRVVQTDALGGSVVAAVDQPGGFSPGVAARVVLDNGARRFVKIVGSSLNPDAPDLYRREAKVAAALPTNTPAPRLLGSYDDGVWVALVFEDVEGRAPSIPWRRDELDRVVGAVVDLGRQLTPSPLELRTLADEADRFDGFRVLLERNALADVDPWVARNLVRLVGLHEHWATATAGTTLLHLDIRGDNVLLLDDRVLFVDWPHACVGAAWIDLVLMLPSVAMQGGPTPESVLAGSGLQPRAADVTVVLAGFAGMLTARGRLPDPSGLPTLRSFQRLQAEQCVRWLCERTGWP